MLTNECFLDNYLLFCCVCGLDIVSELLIENFSGVLDAAKAFLFIKLIFELLIDRLIILFSLLLRTTFDISEYFGAENSLSLSELF